VELGSSSGAADTSRRALSDENNDFQDLIPAVDPGWKRAIDFSEDDPQDLYYARRQDARTTTSPTSDATATRLTGSSLATGHTSTATTNTAVIPTPTGGALDIGPYTCSLSTSFQTFVNVLLMHIQDSQTNVNATMKYLIMNLHAAAPASDPTGPALDLPLGTLPQGKQALGYILDLSMTEYLYSPDDLATQRSDLNSSLSWYAVITSDEPESSYFTVESHYGHSYTPNGWPSASFVEMQRAQRLLAGFGKIDPQMQKYNFSMDKSIIFPSGYLQTSIAPNANLVGGKDCFFNPAVTSVSAVNNSWALGSDASSGPAVFSAAKRYTFCGISPLLNESLAGTTADQDYEPYRDFLEQSIWSWAIGEPQHVFQDIDSDSATGLRCAALNLVTGYWETKDCSNSHYSACSHAGRPYDWSIGDKSTSYTDSDLTCPHGTSFDVPRTALENRYLLHRWRDVRAQQNIKDDLLWVNFNDLDAEGCWVVGQNVTCPYLNRGGNETQVVIPTVAAIIVFVLAALTVFVKCAANRQRTKRHRRRGEDGWDYEGVPS
jgi:hypothetical protein